MAKGGWVPTSASASHSISRMSEPAPSEEFTVDELAQRANMTVRNVRAYASRGLISPPRLEGRTGYYSTEHLRRLQLIRQLLDRGLTLSAVEHAILRSPAAPGQALELIGLMGLPTEDEDNVVMSRAELAALGGLSPDHELFDVLVAEGLVEPLDNDQVRVLDPATVRPGAAAIAIGLSPETVGQIIPHLRSHLGEIADFLVTRVSQEILQPFIDEGLPEDRWQQVLESIESLLPIASQVVLSLFRTQLREAIEAEVGDKLEALADMTPDQKPHSA